MSECKACRGSGEIKTDKGLVTCPVCGGSGLEKG